VGGWLPVLFCMLAREGGREGELFSFMATYTLTVSKQEHLNPPKVGICIRRWEGL